MAGAIRRSHYRTPRGCCAQGARTHRTTLSRRFRQRPQLFRTSPMRRRIMGVPRMGAQCLCHHLDRRFLRLAKAGALSDEPYFRRRHLGNHPPRRRTTPRRPLQTARGMARRRRRAHSGLCDTRGPGRAHSHVLSTGVGSATL